MDSSLHPEHGGRVLLELDEVGDAAVRYRVTLYTPDARFEGWAALETASGETTHGGLNDAPAWLVAQLRPFLRQLWTGRRGGSGPRWPRRVLRWRQER